MERRRAWLTGSRPDQESSTTTSMKERSSPVRVAISACFSLPEGVSLTLDCGCSFVWHRATTTRECSCGSEILDDRRPPALSIRINPRIAGNPAWLAVDTGFEIQID